MSLSVPPKAIWTETHLRNVSNGWRKLGKKIVFTNGCFDLLHIGHLDCLTRARALGDILIVGVNNDDSVRQLKGESRPIISEISRLLLVAGLECVDYVYLFTDKTAHRPIQLVRPHIYVKAGSREEDIPEARYARQFGATVELLPIRYLTSTSGICQRIVDAEIGKADVLLR